MLFFQTRLNRSELVCNIFTCLMLGVFPVFLVPGLFFTLNIAKYCFVLISTLLLFLFSLLFSKKSTIKAKRTLFADLSIVDWAILLLCVVSLVSGFVSPFFPDTVNGAYGRFNGMLTMLCYTVLYFIITRYGKWNVVFFYLLAVSSALVFLLGILNFFQIDPLGAYSSIRTDEKALFLSTIGNRNFFSAYICITLPVFIVLFCLSNVRWKTFFWGAMMILGEAALFIGNSESGLIGLYLFFLVLPLFLFHDKSCFRNYFFVIFSFFAVAQVLRILISVLPNALYSLSGISAFFVFHIFSKMMTGVFAILCLSFWFPPFSGRRVRCCVKKIWVGFLLFLICVFLVFFFYFSFINRQTPLGELEAYLRFSPSWGSNRGSAWIALVAVFASFSPLHILIGSGPDTIYQVLSQAYYLQMENGTLLSFDSAHNEYLQYLITTGVIGLLAYCVFVAVLLSWALSQGKRSHTMLSLAMAVLCYSVQGFFNISMISVTPVFVLLLAFVGADYRDARLRSKLD